jgi:hypothetical protein
MKKECAQVRKALPNYLRGHLFKLEQLRIERHLRSCVVCYSQYDALKRADETRQYLKDITPPEGVVQRMKEGVFGLAKLKKLIYRPLWIAGIIAAAAIVYYYVITPRKLDVELDRIIKTAPSSTAAVPAPVPLTPVARPAAAPPVAPAHAATRVMEPLLVSVTTEDDKAAIRRINQVMREHGRLRKFKFTDTVRDISGNLTAKELLTFFNRIGSVGKVSYSRKRFESFPSAQPIPFVMKLTVEPKARTEKAPSAQPAQKPVEAAAPVTIPTPSTTAQ